MSWDTAEKANISTDQQPRNKHFHSDNPFADDPSLSLLGATGSFKYFNPTSAQYSWSGWNPDERPAEPGRGLNKVPSCERRQDESETEQEQLEEHDKRGEIKLRGEHDREQRAGEEDKHEGDGGDEEKEEEKAGELEGQIRTKRKDVLLSYLWRSRDNRKGRHTIVLRRKKDKAEQPSGTLEPTNTFPATLRGIVAMPTRFPYWDLSWWLSVVFALGSLVYMVNGLITMLPEVEHSPRKMNNASAWTAFAGAGIFFIGSVLLMLEAVNANRSGCFGWAIERIIRDGRPQASVQPGYCGHHHYHETSQRDKIEGEEDDDAAAAKEIIYLSGSQDDCLAGEIDEIRHSHPHHWIWWPTWRDLRLHFLYEIGFLACTLQLCSATLFWLSKFTGLPSVSRHLSQGVIDGTHFGPQIVGCLGFIIVCLLFMVETQQSWLMPAPSILGWHVGLWKLIGSIGFTLSAILGPLGQHGMGFATRQAGVASFWGSCALFIGSLVQWYESLAKHSVVEEGTSQYSEWNEEFIEEDEERRDE